jgi:hypothetical protein
VLAAAVVFALSGTAWAQDKNYSGPEQGIYEGEYVWFYDVKSPPHTETDIFSTFWIFHVSWTATNYCGFLIDLVYDGSEMSFITLRPFPPHVAVEPPGAGLVTSVQFPGSGPGMTTVAPIAFWITPTLAANSGITIVHTDILGMFQVTGHVKDVVNPAPTAIVNSDVDITISIWDIWHVLTPGTYQLFPSDWVYRTPGGVNFADFPGDGTWIHVTETFTTFVPFSAFFATGMSHSNLAGYGIDHFMAPTPIEPLSIILVLGGVGAVVAGRVWQRKKK